MNCRYRYRLLRAGALRLDGGSMFGLIPRVVWQRAVPASMIDERGRITLQHNCLLLERLDEPEAASAERMPGGSPKLILIEAGTGDKLDEKSRDIFALDGRSVLDALREVGCRAEDVGGAVVTHLHFDHAGGLTRLAGPGESPDWTGPGSSFAGARGEVRVRLTLPNARVVTQAREWRDALAGRSVMTRTYFADHLEPLRDRVVLVDSMPPFAPGTVPDRNDLPLGALEQRETEVFPGVWVFRVPGHTWGQQAVRFLGPGGESVVFTPDVMPTAWHVGQAYSLAYDVEPYMSMVSRTWFLGEAADRGWVLCLDHEPGNPFRRVQREASGRGWYELVEAEVNGGVGVG